MANNVAPQVDAKLAESIANTIRFLSADGVQQANSGHPGMPMGCADIATVLLTRFLNIDPSDTHWFNRDRFVLSAGHGSMLLYSMLHLAGILPMEELKHFRQVGSLTPGHPEFGHVPGCDVTGGPLGAGFATATGIALAEQNFAARYNRENFNVVDHFTYVIMGDGCNMEGLSQEAASLAGHLKLGKLIAFYDDNEISIDGSTDLAFTENVNARYEALGWHVQDIDGHDHEAIANAIIAAQADERPSIIVAHTTIAKGAPTLAGTSASHGAPLGEEEISNAKKALGLPDEKFYVPQEVYDYFETRKSQWQETREQYNELVSNFHNAHEESAVELDRIIAGELPENWKAATPNYPADAKGIASRASGGKVMNEFGAAIPELVGGSADLNPSTKTVISQGQFPGFVQAGDYEGRNIHFGVREHAMGHITNGLALHGLIPYCATFLVFHDYMRPALRMAALMGCRSIFIYTHDSFYVGEDGPTHQPVEHIAAMRAIPRLHVMRPADANETAYAWQYAIARDYAPTTMALTRQNLPTLDRENLADANGTLMGGYIISDQDDADLALIATGSEVSLALESADRLRAEGKKVRVISMPCLELFNEQSDDYREMVLPHTMTKRVVIEAGISQGWGKILGFDGLFIGREDFCESGPAGKLAIEFGFTAEAVCEKINDAAL